MQCRSCIHPLAIDGDLGLSGREGRTGPSILEYRQLSPLDLLWWCETMWR